MHTISTALTLRRALRIPRGVQGRMNDRYLSRYVTRIGESKETLTPSLVIQPYADLMLYCQNMSEKVTVEGRIQSSEPERL